MASSTNLYSTDKYVLIYDHHGDYYTLTRLGDGAKVHFAGSLACTFERESGFLDRNSRVVVFGENFDWLASDYDAKME